MILNRLPMGNMWSVIPVALLCMIVNWSERRQGSCPEGDKVLEMRGLLFVHSLVLPVFLRPEICLLRPEIYPLRPKICPIRPWIWEGRFKASKDWYQTGKADFRPERVDFRPERADFRPEKDWGTNEWTNKSPLFYRTLSPSGQLPCFLSLQFTIMQSRAIGIIDYILPIGNLFNIVCQRFFFWIFMQLIYSLWHDTNYFHKIWYLSL